MAHSSHDQGQDQTKVVIRTKKGDHLSRVAGWAMYDAAVKAEVPMYAVDIKSPAPDTAQQAFDTILKGEQLKEAPENGWTIFTNPDEKNEFLKEALDLLSIPLSLSSLWKSRGSESNFNSLINVQHPDFKSYIYPNIHDSLGLTDPKGIGEFVGINSSPRNIIYRGVLK